MDRRHFLTACGASLVAQSGSVFAQGKPATLRVLCGYPAGGSVDIVSRKIAEKLAARYATTAIVENKSGAAGRIAMQELKQGASDGSLLLITPASVVTMYTHVFRNPGYDAFADAVPVSMVAQTAFALCVGPRVPASVVDAESLARWAKSQRQPIQCGNAGAGSMPHFIAMLMGREMGFEMQHIPFRGGSAAAQAVAAGDVDMTIGTEAAARPLAQAGKIRVLATTGAKQSPFFREARTLKDQGRASMVFEEWFGALMPARTPATSIEAVATIIADAINDRDIREIWDTVGLVPVASTPAQLADAIRAEHAFWKKTVADFAFTPEA